MHVVSIICIFLPDMTVLFGWVIDNVPYSKNGFQKIIQKKNDINQDNFQINFNTKYCISYVYIYIYIYRPYL